MKTGEKNPTLKTPHIAVKNLQPKPRDCTFMQGNGGRVGFLFWALPICCLLIAQHGNSACICIDAVGASDWSNPRDVGIRSSHARPIRNRGKEEINLHRALCVSQPSNQAQPLCGVVSGTQVWGGLTPYGNVCPSR